MPLARALVVLLVCCAAAAGPELSLEQANQRWAGVRCRLKVNFPMLRGQDLSGWTGSRFLETGGSSRGKTIKVGIGVSDRAALSKAGVIRDNRLPVGTELLALGWRYRDAGKQRDLMLELRFADAPHQALMRFEGGDVSGDLAAVEQVLRAEIFVMPETGAAAAVPEAAPQPTPAAPPPGPPRAAPEQPRVFNPAVKMLGASVNPARAARGAEVELLIHYALENLPDGVPFEVLERRQLKSGDAQLGNFEEKLPRTTGTYTSTQKIRVPDDLPPGVYTFEASVTLAGKTALATALFEIR